MKTSTKSRPWPSSLQNARMQKAVKPEPAELALNKQKCWRGPYLGAESQTLRNLTSAVVMHLTYPATRLLSKVETEVKSVGQGPVLGPQAVAPMTLLENSSPKCRLSMLCRNKCQAVNTKEKSLDNMEVSTSIS